MVETPLRPIFAHACLALCLLLAAAPMVLVDYPPIFDYPNHLARAQVIASLDRSAIFQAHFQQSSFLIPNVLADLVVLALMPLGGVMVAGKVLLLLTFALTLTGAYALNRQVTGQFNPWPLMAAVFLYNEGFFWGFLNYNLGLGLMLWGLAAWVALRHRPAWIRVAVGTAFALAVFFAHLVAFGLYAVAVAVIELHRRATLPQLAVGVAQFMLPLAVFVGLSPSGELDVVALFDFSIPGKIMPFARVISSGNPLLDFATLAATGGALAVALLGGLARTDRSLGLVAAVFLLLELTLPYSMLGSYFLDSRIVVAIALMLMTSLTPRRGMAAAWVVLAIVGGRSYALMDDWRLQDDDTAAVIATLDQVPPGSVIVTAVGHPFELGDWVATRRIKPSHEHTTLYATIRNSVLVPNIFARPGQNPLTFHSSLEALDRAARNPVARIFHSGDARWMVGEMLPLADTAHTITPPIPAVYIIGYHVPCAWWPVDMPIRAVACDPTYSLIEILGGVTEPIP
ncbi:MAG: hypothetical protein H7Y60_17770 [Rhodospirillaceae bacterium]|nr:hypothetical protein [Rhodospirillales bacterium]